MRCVEMVQRNSSNMSHGPNKLFSYLEKKNCSWNTGFSDILLLIYWLDKLIIKIYGQKNLAPVTLKDKYWVEKLLEKIYTPLRDDGPDHLKCCDIIIITTFRAVIEYYSHTVKQLLCASLCPVLALATGYPISNCLFWESSSDALWVNCICLSSTDSDPGSSTCFKRPSTWIWLKLCVGHIFAFGQWEEMMMDRGECATDTRPPPSDDIGPWHWYKQSQFLPLLLGSRNTSMSSPFGFIRMESLMLLWLDTRWPLLTICSFLPRMCRWMILWNVSLNSRMR